MVCCRRRRTLLAGLGPACCRVRPRRPSARLTTTQRAFVWSPRPALARAGPPAVRSFPPGLRPNLSDPSAVIEHVFEQEKQVLAGPPTSESAALLLGLNVSALTADQAWEVVLSCERLVRAAHAV